MIGWSIQECKSAKIKVLNPMISSTGQDIMLRVPAYLLEGDSRPDFFVQNGMKKKARPKNEFYEQVELVSKQENIPILIRELPILRQISLGQTDKHTEFADRWIRFSWNSFFMDEGIHPYDPTYNRWSELQNKYNIEVMPQKIRGDYVLFCLQLDGDSALNKLIYNNKKYKDYCCEEIKKIKKLTDRPILIRSHPLDKTVIEHIKKTFKDTIEYSDSPDLYYDLNRSYCMVTYNSTSSVESVLYGTPTIALDSSAVTYPVANNLVDIENLKEFDLTEWLKRIAFMQWQGKELTSGYVWKLLKQTIELT